MKTFALHRGIRASVILSIGLVHSAPTLAAILDNGTVNCEGKSLAIELKNGSVGVAMEFSDAIVTIHENEVPANFDWSFLPAIAPASGNSQFFTALKPNGTIVTLDMFYDPSNSPPRATARIAFLSEDGNATGTAKVSFDSADINGLVLQPDEKLLLTGSFTRVNGQQLNSLVRLNQDGSLDSAFKADFGSVQTSNSSSSFEVKVLTVFPDGRIVVNVVDYAANIISILVLGADGRFDRSFTPTKVSEEFCCFSMLGATTPDGKILLFGPRGVGLLRLGFNGGVDDTFKPDFQMPTDPDSEATTTGGIQAVLSQADGRLIVTGDFTSVNGTPRSYIARLNPDGSLDPSFKAALLRPFQRSYPGTASILSNGAILVLSAPDDFVEFDSDGHERTCFTVPRSMVACPVSNVFGRFALQSEVPKRILLLNGFGCVRGVNGVAIGLARVLLEGAATAFQIMDAVTINENEHSLEFVVQRLGETIGPATVKFSTSDGTAKAGVDYISQAETLNFAQFETEKLVKVPLTELTNRESRVFFMSLSEATGATLSGQPSVPVMIFGKALPPGKITPLRMPNGGVALIFGQQSFEFESSSLVEVSSDLNTWLPSTGYRFKSSWNDYNAVVWIDNHSRFDSPRFYRVREYQP